MLILNKKSISNYEQQLFQAELEKFRPHQNRLLQANHKQSSLMKELTATFNTLLQDKRVRSEQSKYETMTRQRTAVMSKYKRIYEEFRDLEAGLQNAKQWYGEMRDTVDSLDKNVETFVNNRRSEGAQLLSQIEQDRASASGGQADRERQRLQELMERMSMDPATSPTKSKTPQPFSHSTASPGPRYPSTKPSQYQAPMSPPPQQPVHPQSTYSNYTGPQHVPVYQPTPPHQRTDSYGQMQAQQAGQGGYDPSSYFRRDQSQPTSPPPTQQQFAQNQYNYGQQQASQPYIPPGYVPPPPPRGPPPLGPQQTFPQQGNYQGQGGYSYGVGNGQQARNGMNGQPAAQDPWAGLNAWK